MSEAAWQAVGVVVAVMAALVSAYFSHRSIQASRAQQHAQLFALERQHYDELRRWADQGVDVLTAAIFLCDVDPQQLPERSLFHRWLPVKERLSATLDKGRFFLANEPVPHGLDKPTAYRGFRPPELDPLKRAYDCLREFSMSQQSINEALRDRLWRERQHFVSNLQELLDPAGRTRRLREMSGATTHELTLRV